MDIIGYNNVYCKTREPENEGHVTRALPGFSNVLGHYIKDLKWPFCQSCKFALLLLGCVFDFVLNTVVVIVAVVPNKICIDLPTRSFTYTTIGAVAKPNEEWLLVATSAQWNPSIQRRRSGHDT